MTRARSMRSLGTATGSSERRRATTSPARGAGEAPSRLSRLPGGRRSRPTRAPRRGGIVPRGAGRARPAPASRSAVRHLRRSIRCQSSPPAEAPGVLPAARVRAPGRATPWASAEGRDTPMRATSGSSGGQPSVRDHHPGARETVGRVASPFVVFERDEVSSVAGSPPFDEASGKEGGYALTEEVAAAARWRRGVAGQSCPSRRAGAEPITLLCPPI